MKISCPRFTFYLETQSCAEGSSVSWPGSCTAWGEGRGARGCPPSTRSATSLLCFSPWYAVLQFEDGGKGVTLLETP